MAFGQRREAKIVTPRMATCPIWACRAPGASIRLAGGAARVYEEPSMRALSFALGLAAFASLLALSPRDARA